MHEHIARTMYYFSIHLVYASAVGAAALALTSIRGASATTKYWIWVATAFNFILPVGALIDKLWASQLTWATPLGAIGSPIWDMTQGRTAVALAVIWIAGGVAMLIRLISRLRREGREAQVADSLSVKDAAPGFITDGIPVSFDTRHPAPAVGGVFYPCILLPIGIDRLLNQREFDAVLLHELVHARRRDNLIRVVYELSSCILWFHPLVWITGRRLALYRELSCDEAVIDSAQGEDLVSALAKLASPENELLLQATATSFISHRLAGLTATLPQPRRRAANALLAAVFVLAFSSSVFGTIAHTACCFVKKAAAKSATCTASARR